VTNTSAAPLAYSSPLVAAIESAWRVIQASHIDVPDVVVTLASGSSRQGMTLGHFAADRWVSGETTVHELFIGGEGLARGGADVLGTLLHEATHGAAQTRGIKSTSRGGRYHNRKFQEIGEELGLSLTYDPTLGWSSTTVPTATAARYSPEVAAITAALNAHRLAEATTGGRTSNNNGVSAMCECGRKIRLSRAVYADAPIICGRCGGPFEAAPDEQQ